MVEAVVFAAAFSYGAGDPNIFRSEFQEEYVYDENFYYA
jgi:hypothetical protein